MNNLEKQNKYKENRATRAKMNKEKHTHKKQTSHKTVLPHQQSRQASGKAAQDGGHKTSSATKRDPNTDTVKMKGHGALSGCVSHGQII